MDMISEHHYYDNGYLCLGGIELPELPQTLKIKDTLCYKKPKFHISLVCAKNIAAIIDEQNPAKVEQEIVNEFKQFINTQPLTDYKIIPRFYFVRREGRQTLIVMAEVNGLTDFFDLLRQKYKTDLPNQPTHITIYTVKDGRGIGILSDEILARDGEVVEVPELAHLL